MSRWSIFIHAAVGVALALAWALTLHWQIACISGGHHAIDSGLLDARP